MVARALKFSRVVCGQIVMVDRDPRLPESDAPIQEAAAALWAVLWPKRPWPRVLVKWVWRCPGDGRTGVAGRYIDRRRPVIELSYCNLRLATPGFSTHAEDAFETLVHELVHARVGVSAGHGPHFQRTLSAALRRAWSLAVGNRQQNATSALALYTRDGEA